MGEPKAMIVAFRADPDELELKVTNRGYSFSVDENIVLCYYGHPMQSMSELTGVILFSVAKAFQFHNGQDIQCSLYTVCQLFEYLTFSIYWYHRSLTR